jgi:hypothetical protein
MEESVDSKKTPKIEFAPGCFDHLGDDVTQEEIDALMVSLQEALESGTLFEQGQELTAEEFDELPEEVRDQILGNDRVRAITLPSRKLH